jgi:hypothetical protein
MLNQCIKYITLIEIHFVYFYASHFILQMQSYEEIIKLIYLSNVSAILRKGSSGLMFFTFENVSVESMYKIKLCNSYTFMYQILNIENATYETMQQQLNDNRKSLFNPPHFPFRMRTCILRVLHTTSGYLLTWRLEALRNISILVQDFIPRRCQDCKHAQVTLCEI